MKNGMYLLIAAGIAVVATVIVFLWPFSSAPKDVSQEVATTTPEVQAESVPVTNTKESKPMASEQQDPLTEIKAIVARMRVLHSGQMTAEQEAEADTLQARYRELIPVLNALEKDGVAAAVNVIAHGYDLVVSVNGKRITHFNGQNSASAWLYSPEHYMSELVMEDSKELVALKPGENTIRIEYTQTKPNEDFTLNMTAYDSDFEVLNVAVSGTTGVIEKTFTLAPTLPAGAQTIVVKE